ncbi:MAG TPA: pilus assembly protein N-terminal domain-containing protein [Terracidiphilus sp.]
MHAQGSPSPSASSRSAYRDSADELSVTVGKTVVVDCAQPVARLALGLGDLAEVSAVSPTEIVVSGKAAGQTSLVIWDTHGGRQFFDVTVLAAKTGFGDPLEPVRRELKTEFPGQDLKVSLENGSVILRGTAKDLTSAQRALQIASSAGKVLNLLNVQVPTADPQILLKVRFASVDRNRARDLGINFFSLGFGNVLGGITTGQFSPPSISGGGSGGSGNSGGVSGPGGTAAVQNELNILAFLPGLGVGATVKALETQGVVQVLSEPNLLATNGKQASFLAGGEYPYPVVQGTGGQPTVTIEFKEYGVRLNFIPTITPRGSLRLQVAPEVSALDFTNAVQISGFNVPAITTRKVNTEVELSDGQSFVIGGLLDNRETQTLQKIPFISEIPVLGKFFQSISKNRTNTELIVIVTPEIVAPLAAGAPLPELNFPEKFLPPNSAVPMHQPDAKTSENTLAPAPPSLPMEKLIDSMKPEAPLVIEGEKGSFGGSSTGAASSSTPAPAPQ